MSLNGRIPMGVHCRNSSATVKVTWLITLLAVGTSFPSLLAAGDYEYMALLECWQQSCLFNELAVSRGRAAGNGSAARENSCCSL